MLFFNLPPQELKVHRMPAISLIFSVEVCSLSSTTNYGPRYQSDQQTDNCNDDWCQTDIVHITATYTLQEDNDKKAKRVLQSIQQDRCHGTKHHLNSFPKHAHLQATDCVHSPTESHIKFLNVNHRLHKHNIEKTHSSSMIFMAQAMPMNSY